MTLDTMNNSAIACTVILGLLMFGLGAAISTLRLGSGTLTGTGVQTNSMLHRLVRAHGNTAEYVPFLAVLFLYLGSRGPTPLQVWLMAGATASRVLVVLGLLVWRDMGRVNPARFIGALGTYFCGAVLCIELLRAA
jgi:uncharacterized membrane protein YecN with MAPEG domain